MTSRRAVWERSGRVSRKLVGALGLLALAVVLVTARPALKRLLPLGLWRRLTVGMLLAILAGYVIVALAATVGTVVLGAWVLRRRRQGRPRLVAGRWLALCGAALFGLTFLEGAALGWQGWRHRFPRLPEQLPAREASRERTLLVLGESSAVGAPYDDPSQNESWLSVGQIVAWQLERVEPGRRWRVEMWARRGSPLEPMHQKLAGLTFRPDAILVYCGHNEFQARYPWSRMVPYYVEPGAAWRLWDRVRRAPKPPLAAMILETLDRHQLDLAPTASSTRPVIDRPVCTAAETEALRADFERRLEAIADYADRIGSVPILIIPPGNDGGFEPNRSVLDASIPISDHPTIAREFLAVRALEESDSEAARSRYRAFLDRYPGFAEAHFRLGRLCERAGRAEDAETQFRFARDHDGMPQRCPSSFQEAYRTVAARHPRAVLVDGPKVFGRISPGGVPGDPLFHDAHHPTFLGYVALAQAALNQVAMHRALDWPEGKTAPRIESGGVRGPVRHEYHAVGVGLRTLRSVVRE